ncbi:unnamed protein product [Brassicogethes aeneus]|uniref:Uncharacterized protein n=1 Tax=Brassicogethes aeneus TaxID=1431903 RepID=A0A9P0B4N6_BRAAE|nr:unnamed protein product [Brassicogethes aeneus]
MTKSQYKGNCYELGQPFGPCAQTDMDPHIFDVNATTLNVECLSGADTLYLFDVEKVCRPGSKKDADGKLKQYKNRKREVSRVEKVRLKRNRKQTSEDGILKTAQKHAVPKAKTSLARQKFNSRIQGVDEDFDSYLKELRQLAQPCEYGELKESIIEDVIISGIREEKVKNKLLTYDRNLTLDMEIKICKASEAANKNIMPLQQERRQKNMVMEINNEAVLNTEINEAVLSTEINIAIMVMKINNEADTITEISREAVTFTKAQIR